MLPQGFSFISFLLFSLSIALPASADARKKVDLQSAQIVELYPTDTAELGLLAAREPTGELNALLSDGGEAVVSTALVDLNDDRRPEVFVEFEGPAYCGIRDCQVLVLSPSGDGKFTPLFRGNASTIAISSESSNGWKQIITNPDFDDSTGVIWERKGSEYALQ